MIRSWNSILVAGVPLMGLLLVVPAEAQFAKLVNPQFKVTLTHPPQILIKGTQKVGVNQFTGDCGLELSERLLQGVAASGKFEVIDRGNLDAVLKEQQFQMTGAVSEQSAIKLGQLLGAAAMFVGTVTRCTIVVSDALVVPGEFKDSRGLPATKYIRRATAQMTASVKLVDFTTGKTHTGQLVEAKSELVNEALNAHPEPPDREAARTLMYQDAVRKLMRMITPWNEVVQITVYDDDDANKFRLKASAD